LSLCSNEADGRAFPMSLPIPFSGAIRDRFSRHLRLELVYCVGAARRRLHNTRGHAAAPFGRPSPHGLLCTAVRTSAASAAPDRGPSTIRGNPERHHRPEAIPNWRHTALMPSPSRRRATKRSRSSITEHSLHGINTSGKSQKCYPGVRYRSSPMSQFGHNDFAVPFQPVAKGNDASVIAD
jgi:hypothetical protein